MASEGRIAIDRYLDGDSTRAYFRVEESWWDWCQQQGEGAKAAAGRAEEEQRRDRRAIAEQARQRAVP
jgi:hypothetical protein